MFGEASHKLRYNTHQAQFEKRRERERQWEESVERMAATNKIDAFRLMNDCVTRLVSERPKLELSEIMLMLDIAFATWENKTAARIASLRGRRRLTELEHGGREALLARRHRLADLYNKEIYQWECEILNSAETVEERKQRILGKATKLRDARENARRQFAQDCYDRQWRDACDDARSLDSHANTIWVTAQRGQQLEEKVAVAKENARIEEQHMQKILERIRFLEAQERAAKEERERRNQLLRQDLKIQVAYNAERRVQLWEQNAREDYKELEELRAIVRAEEEREEARRRGALARGAEIRENNKVRSEMRAIAAKEARERDRVLLDYAIKKDRAGEAEEKAKKDEEKRMLYQYGEYLKEQMQKETEGEAEYDAVRKKAEMRIWDERDAQLKARHDAREALMKEVHLGRQEQLRLKAVREQEQLDADVAQARHDLKTFQAEQECENQNEMRKLQERLENAQVLREQMADRRAQDEKIRQEEFLATKQMEAYETKHKDRLGQQAGRVITYHPLKHTQWYT